MIALSDRVFGWDSDYDTLFDASLEAIRADPWPYVEGVGETFWDFLSQRYAPEPRERPVPIPDLPAELTIDGKPFPAPITVSPLVEAVRYGLVWCPTDDIERCVVPDPEAALGDPDEARRYDELIDTVRDWNAQLPTRDSNAWLASKGGTASDRWPRSILWIAVAAVALVVRRPRGSAPILVLMGVGALVLGVHALSQAPQSEFALPFVPVWIVAALVGLLAPRGGTPSHRAVESRRRARARPHRAGRESSRRSSSSRGRRRSSCVPAFTGATSSRSSVGVDGAVLPTASNATTRRGGSTRASLMRTLRCEVTLATPVVARHADAARSTSRRSSPATRALARARAGGSAHAVDALRVLRRDRLLHDCNAAIVGDVDPILEDALDGRSPGLHGGWYGVVLEAIGDLADARRRSAARVDACDRRRRGSSRARRGVRRPRCEASRAPPRQRGIEAIRAPLVVRLPTRTSTSRGTSRRRSSSTPPSARTAALEPPRASLTGRSRAALLQSRRAATRADSPGRVHARRVGRPRRGRAPRAPRRHVPRERARRGQARRLRAPRLHVQLARPRRASALGGAERRGARLRLARPRRVLLLEGPRRARALRRPQRARRDPDGAAAAPAPARRARRPPRRRRPRDRGELGLARHGHLQGAGDRLGEAASRPRRPCRRDDGRRRAPGGAELGGAAGGGAPAGRAAARRRRPERAPVGQGDRGDPRAREPGGEARRVRLPRRLLRRARPRRAPGRLPHALARRRRNAGRPDRADDQGQGRLVHGAPRRARRRRRHVPLARRRSRRRDLRGRRRRAPRPDRAAVRRPRSRPARARGGASARGRPRDEPAGRARERRRRRPTAAARDAKRPSTSPPRTARRSSSSRAASRGSSSSTPTSPPTAACGRSS